MSDTPEMAWGALCVRQLGQHRDVREGRMMSAPALALNGKVYAFYSTKGGGVGLGLRLGRDFDFDSLRVAWQHLAPFKTKPPMKDWIVVGLEDLDQWDALADSALSRARQR